LENAILLDKNKMLRVHFIDYNQLININYFALNFVLAVVNQMQSNQLPS